MRKLNVFIGLCVGFICFCIVTAVALSLLTLLFKFVGEALGCAILLLCMIIPVVILIYTLANQLEELGSKTINLFKK